MTHSPCPECSVVCCLLLTSRNSQDFIHATHTWLIVFPMLTGSFVLQCLDFRVGWKEIYRIPIFAGKHNREPRIFDGKTNGFRSFQLTFSPEPIYSSTRTSSSRKPRSLPVCAACPASMSPATAEHAWVWWKS
jgi:hypothetical protein